MDLVISEAVLPVVFFFFWGGELIIMSPVCCWSSLLCLCSFCYKSRPLFLNILTIYCEKWKIRLFSGLVNRVALFYNTIYCLIPELSGLFLPVCGVVFN